MRFVLISSYEFLPWSYTCDKYSRCVKGAAVKPGEEGAAMSLGRCKLTCGEDNVLWPKPRQAKLGKQVTAVSPKDVRILNEADFKVSNHRRCINMHIQNLRFCNRARRLSNC